jgi:transcriptional regulator with AAA-type ATPase domain
MEYAVLECRQEGPETIYRATHVDATHIRQRAREGRLSLFYVSESQASDLQKTIPEIRVLGRKLPGKELSRYLAKLAENEIGILQGAYDSTRQLKRSAHDAFRKCHEQRHNLVAFISLKPAVFAQAWKKELSNSLCDAPPAPPDSESPVERTLRTLGELEVPDSLLKAYIGNAPSIRLIRQLILRACDHAYPVLIQGESGTGKEIIARSIHDLSRAHGRGPEFRPINCSAISPFLLESELFGHLKDSSDRATKDRDGLWKSANNGSIFLDEIGDLSLDQQAKILRALDTNRVKPVGSDEEVPVRARVISATNRDLYTMIRDGRFREDLYFRLSVIPIHTPPLREHPEDIELIANWLWSEIAGKSVPALSGEILTCLREYTWPGNVRELKSILSSLRGYFGIRPRTRDQFETVMFLKGQPAAVSSPPTARQTATRSRAESFQHLRRIDGVLRGIEVFLKALNGRRPLRDTLDAQTALGERHRELTHLCQKPLLFASPKTFDAVYGVCGKVVYLLDSMQIDSTSPPRSATRHLVKEIQATRAKVQKAVDGLMPKPRNQRS